MGNNSFYSESELKQLGLKAYGENVLISRKASIYSPETITLGSNVRIDDFCIISGDVTIGDFVHIAAYCALYGTMGIHIGDYSGISPRTIVLSSSDDFSGEFLFGPTAPKGTTKVTGGLVDIGRFVIIGAGCVVFPNLKIPDGAAVGAMALVNKNLEPWSIYGGVPARFIKKERKICFNMSEIMVSALMITYNHEAFIREAIEGVFNYLA